MKQYINKADLVKEIEKAIDETAPSHDQQCQYEDGYYCGLYKAESIIDTLEVKEMDLTDRKTDWRPSKKQMESLGALVRYNIGVFDYQKLNEVAILYDDLTKILDYETDRQK